MHALEHKAHLLSLALFSSNVDHKLPIFQINFVASASKIFICTHWSIFGFTIVYVPRMVVVRMRYKNAIHLVLHTVYNFLLVCVNVDFAVHFS